MQFPVTATDSAQARAAIDKAAEGLHKIMDLGHVEIAPVIPPK